MPRFILGARVDGLYDRNEDSIWYPGYIEKVHQLTLDDGTQQQSYDILYDDGEREEQVLDNYIRSHIDGTISMGTRVSGKYAGGHVWYTGSIFEVQDDGKYTIKYDDGEMERDVLKNYIKELEEPKRFNTEVVKETSTPPDVPESSTSEVKQDDVEEGEDQEYDSQKHEKELVDQEEKHQVTESVNTESSPNDQPDSIRTSSDDAPLEEVVPVVSSDAVNEENTTATATSFSVSVGDTEQAQITNNIAQFRQHIGDPVAMKSILSVLVKQMRAHPQLTSELLHELQGEKLIVDVLTFHGSHAVIQCYGLVLLRRLCFLCSDSTPFFLSHGIIHLITIAMKKFPDDAILQASACGALAVFPRISFGLSVLLEHKILQLVLITMAHHKSYSIHTRQVHYYASELLLDLCEIGDSSALTILCGDQIVPGYNLTAVSLLLYLLRQSLSLDDKKASCAVGTLLMALAASSRHAAGSILRQSGLAEISTLMAKYPTDTGIQKYCKAASKEIALCSIQGSPTRRIQETASEILEESNSRESFRHDAASFLALGASSPSSKSPTQPKSSNPSSVSKSKFEHHNITCAHYKDPSAFSKYASPIGKAPNFPMQRGFSSHGQSPASQPLQHVTLAGGSVESVEMDFHKHRSPYDSGDRYGKAGVVGAPGSMSHRSPTNASLHSGYKWVDGRSKEDMKNALLFDAYGVQPPPTVTAKKASKQVQMQNDNKRAGLKTPGGPSWATHVAQAHSSIEPPRPSSVKKPRSAGLSQSTQHTLNGATATKSTGHDGIPKAVSKPEVAGSVSTKNGGIAFTDSSASKAVIGTSESEPTEQLAKQPESLNALAIELFLQEQADLEMKEKERLSFAEKLHKMIDKAKSTLTANGITPVHTKREPVKKPQSVSKDRSTATVSTKNPISAAPPRATLATSSAAPKEISSSKPLAAKPIPLTKKVIGAPAAATKPVIAPKPVALTATPTSTSSVPSAQKQSVPVKALVAKTKAPTKVTTVSARLAGITAKPTPASNPSSKTTKQDKPLTLSKKSAPKSSEKHAEKTKDSEKGAEKVPESSATKESTAEAQETSTTGNDSTSVSIDTHVAGESDLKASGESSDIHEGNPSEKVSNSSEKEEVNPNPLQDPQAPNTNETTVSTLEPSAPQAPVAEDLYADAYNEFDEEADGAGEPASPDDVLGPQAYSFGDLLNFTTGNTESLPEATVNTDKSSRTGEDIYADEAYNDIEDVSDVASQTAQDALPEEQGETSQDLIETDSNTNIQTAESLENEQRVEQHDEVRATEDKEGLTHEERNITEATSEAIVPETSVATSIKVNVDNSNTPLSDEKTEDGLGFSLNTNFSISSSQEAFVTIESVPSQSETSSDAVSHHEVEDEVSEKTPLVSEVSAPQQDDPQADDSSIVGYNDGFDDTTAEADPVIAKDSAPQQNYPQEDESARHESNSTSEAPQHIDIDAAPTIDESNSSPELVQEDPADAPYQEEFEDRNIDNDNAPNNDPTESKAEIIAEPVEAESKDIELKTNGTEEAAHQEGFEDETVSEAVSAPSDTAATNDQSHEVVHDHQAELQVEDAAMETYESKSNSYANPNQEMAGYNSAPSHTTKEEAIEVLSPSEQHKDDDFDVSPSEKVADDEFPTSGANEVDPPSSIATFEEVSILAELSPKYPSVTFALDNEIQAEGVAAEPQDVNQVEVEAGAEYNDEDFDDEVAQEEGQTVSESSETGTHAAETVVVNSSNEYSNLDQEQIIPTSSEEDAQPTEYPADTVVTDSTPESAYVKYEEYQEASSNEISQADLNIEKLPTPRLETEPSTEEIAPPVEKVEPQVISEAAPSLDQDNLYDDFENDDPSTAQMKNEPTPVEATSSAASPSDNYSDEKGYDEFENEDIVTNPVDIEEPPMVEIAAPPSTVEPEAPSAITSPRDNFADEYGEEDFTSSPSTSTPRHEDTSEKEAPLNNHEAVYEEQVSDLPTATADSPVTNEELYEDEYNDFEDDTPIATKQIEEPKAAPATESNTAEGEYGDMDFDEDNAEAVISSPPPQIASPSTPPVVQTQKAEEQQEEEEENAYNDDDFDA